MISFLRVTHYVIGSFRCDLLLWCPDLRCWLTNRRWSQLRSQRSAGALAGNQLLPNASLERDEKALIDLVDGLSWGSVAIFCLDFGPFFILLLFPYHVFFLLFISNDLGTRSWFIWVLSIKFPMLFLHDHFGRMVILGPFQKQFKNTYLIFKLNYFLFLLTFIRSLTFPNNYLHFITISLLFPIHQHGYKKTN
jgi:hypothetical protein